MLDAERDDAIEWPRYDGADSGMITVNFRSR